MYTKRDENFLIDRWRFLYEENFEDEYDEELIELVSSLQPSEE